MREIKFRAFMVEDNHMETGQGLVKSLIGEHGDGTHYHVMQYTGLVDRNGVEIYEGDIVEGGFEKHRGVVEFGNYTNPFGGDQWTGYQCFYIAWDKERSEMTRGDTNYWFSKHMDTAAVVIGNIYENPELLEAEL